MRVLKPTAIVIRTGSLWPAIIYHFLWDRMFFLKSKAIAAKPGAAANPEIEAAMAGGGAVGLPLLIALPNFLCVLVFLRKVRDTSFLEESH